MKLIRYIIAVGALVVAAAAQTNLQINNQTGDINRGFRLGSGKTITFLSNSTVTFNAGSTLTINGTLNLNPTGGTVNFANTTVSGIGAGGITDGSKGDITVSGNGTIWTASGNLLKTVTAGGTAISANSTQNFNIVSGNNSTATVTGNNTNKTVTITVLPSGGSGTGNITGNIPTGNQLVMTTGAGTIAGIPGTIVDPVSGNITFPNVTITDMQVNSFTGNLVKSVIAGNTTVTANSTQAITFASANSNATITGNNTNKTVTINVTAGNVTGGLPGGAGGLWPTADLSTPPTGYFAAGSYGTTAQTALGAWSIIVKSLGDLGNIISSPTAASGPFTTAQTVTLTGDPGATIKFTTNGTDPSRTVGTTYTTGISMSSNTTLKAMQFLNGWVDGPVSTQNYVVTIDSTPPTLTSATISGAGGDVLTLVFSETVSVGSGGNGGFALSLSAGSSTPTYTSGSGSTTLVYTLSTAVPTGVTGTIAYTQPGNGIEDTAGNDLATFSGTSITNSSGYAGGGGGSPGLVDSDNFDSYAAFDQLSVVAPTKWASMNGDVTVGMLGSDGVIFDGGSQRHVRNLATYNANQRAEMTCDLVGSGFSFCTLSVRCQSGANTRYQIQVDGTGYYLVAVSAGTVNVITGHSYAALSLNSGDKIAIEASGSGSSTRLKIQKDVGSGWVDIATNIDPSIYIDGGSPGLGMDNANVGQARLDDWKGYNL